MHGILWIPAGTSLYGDWFFREGDNIKATCEVLKNVGTRNVTVKLFSKAREDSGDGTEVDTSTKIEYTSGSKSGRKDAEWLASAGPKEMLRYQFVVDGAGASAGDGALLRMLTPVWFDTVDVGT